MDIKLSRILGPILILVLTGGSGIGSLYAKSLEEIHQVNQQRTDSARASQARVDQLDEQRQKLLAQYKETTDIIDGLRVYNQQLEKQINAQQLKLQELDVSAKLATVLKRQVTPIMVKMMSALKQFVMLDIPFHQKERSDRLLFISEALVNPDIPDSEKFRQLLEGYQIENEYGRKIDTYTDAIEIGNSRVNVNILRVGRIALIAQTKDEKKTLAWDYQKGQWLELPSSYRNSVRQGIRIARKQATQDMMFLPVSAPIPVKEGAVVQGAVVQGAVVQGAVVQGAVVQSDQLQGSVLQGEELQEDKLKEAVVESIEGNKDENEKANQP